MKNVIDKARIQLKVGVQSKSVINEATKELSYRKVANSGLNCIDYNITWNELDEVIDFENYREHKRIADKYGIAFSQVHGPRYSCLQMPRDMQMFIETIFKSVDVCEILHAPFLVIHPIRRIPYMSYEEVWEMNIAFFTSISQYAVEKGITVCIENLHDRFNGKVVDGIGSSATDILKMIHQVEERVGKKCIGACFDVGHANILRKDLGNEVKILGEYLKAMHIHDNNGDSDDHQIPYSFTSYTTRQPSTDWSGLLVALRNINYQGVLSFETYAALVAIPALEQIELLKYLYAIGQHFSHIICYRDILDAIKDRGIIIFGSGKMLDSYMRYFGCSHKPRFIVDNNSELWGKEKYGINIKNPNEIKGDSVVVICNQYYEEVMMQLENMGITDYILYEEVYRMAGKP